jgi:hypothetical protein
MLMMMMLRRLSMVKCINPLHISSNPQQPSIQLEATNTLTGYDMVTEPHHVDGRLMTENNQHTECCDLINAPC